jgi:cellulose biosynthesis protein BcsQ
MAVYAIWNNKGGVGKSYLTFQIACEYARQHPHANVLVLDACPQANSTIMLLGGIELGEANLDQIATATPLRTISGYVEDRIRSPYASPNTGSAYALQVRTLNNNVPPNVYLVPGDEQLEIQASRVSGATAPGPADAWRIVHQWFSDLISDIANQSDRETTVFIDCNPSFTIYTELALSAADRLMVPFTADGSSRRAVRALFALIYGMPRVQGAPLSQFFLNSMQYRMTIPDLYLYIGNRLTQNLGAANAFRFVVNEIGDEIYRVWQANPNRFAIHPAGSPPPRSRTEFRRMFHAEIKDANTASVVSGALGIPMHRLRAGFKRLLQRDVMVNQAQLERLQPNIEDLVRSIE